MEQYETACLEAIVDNHGRERGERDARGRDRRRPGRERGPADRVGRAAGPGLPDESPVDVQGWDARQPNLSQEDHEYISEFVDEHQAGFAAQLHS